MNLAHIHLLLNHFPTVGNVIALGLLLFGIFGKSKELKEASLAVFFGIALLTIPTYITGNAAQDSVCRSPINTAATDCPSPLPGVSVNAIHEHESAAFESFGFMQLTGFLAWLGLWQYRRMSRLPNWNLSAILLLATVSLVLMTRAALIGGQIHHTEVRDAPAAINAAVGAGRPLARRVGAFVVGTKWVWPTCETLHFVGLSLLFGIAALVDLRILGMMRGLSYRAVHRLMPWSIMGFGINMITGFFFFVGAPQQYTSNPVFHWKLILMMLAGINVLYFTIFDEAWAVDAGEDAPFTAKAVAATALFLVVGVLYCGRMLPFLGNAF
jgi:uncharacterized membrane protein